MKLEPKHIVPYLDKGLKVMAADMSGKPMELKGYTWRIDKWCWQLVISGNPNSSHTGIHLPTELTKPILRPLSDLTKEIEINGGKILPYFSLWWGGSGEPKEVAERYKKITTDDLEKFQYRDIEKLFRWHFDVFGLIDNDLAIDINTINS